jgi:transposase-like protein
LGKLSKTTASRICEELRERFEQFKRRDLYDVQLAALFLDAVFLCVRTVQARRPAPAQSRLASSRCFLPA